MTKEINYHSPVIKDTTVVASNLLCQSRIAPSNGLSLTKDAYDEEDV